jgi:hypothetical protein
MGVREGAIEKYLKEEVEKVGGMTRKWVSPGHKGVPDQIVFHNECVYFVETKTQDGVTSPSQEREIDRLLEMGFDAQILCSKKAVRNFIASITR